MVYQPKFSNLRHDTPSDGCNQDTTSMSTTFTVRVWEDSGRIILIGFRVGQLGFSQEGCVTAHATLIHGVFTWGSAWNCIPGDVLVDVHTLSQIQTSLGAVTASVTSMRGEWRIKVVLKKATECSQTRCTCAMNSQKCYALMRSNCSCKNCNGTPSQSRDNRHTMAGYRQSIPFT